AWLCDVRRRRASDRAAALLVAPLVLFGRAGAPDLVPAALRALVRLALHGDQEVDPPQHAADRRVVGQLASLVHAAETQRLDGRLDLRPGADRTLHERRLEHLVSHPSLRPWPRLPAPPPCRRRPGACRPSDRLRGRAARPLAARSSAAGARPASRALC